ncbi:PLD nuclease N-terminal domain-containing protein [Gracilibacillus saliphilus]|uniref:PLD nuclease N-terminal domain-containing protein n=1 Tax=Gracilibacillus saliphilus TaxID=543890 RepID=UPI0013D55D75|nr:PLD nuclease N-terminal domain-containing protein [Gracilibacillus saliphilus]
MELNYSLEELKALDLTPILIIALPIIVIVLILVVVALVDLYKNRNKRKNVLIWTLIIIFFNTIGPVLYFVMGRKDRDDYEIRN